MHLAASNAAVYMLHLLLAEVNQGKAICDLDAVDDKASMFNSNVSHADHIHFTL